MKKRKQNQQVHVISVEKSLPSKNILMTLKIHVIFHHLEDYFDWTGKSLKYLNGEAVETCHSTLRISEEVHGFKVKKNLGSPLHLKKALTSHIWHNSRKAGFIKPNKLKLRRPNFITMENNK